MAITLLVLPFFFAAVAWAVPGQRVRPLLLPLAALVHLGLTWELLRNPVGPLLGGWLDLDALGRMFLLLVSVLFLASACYAVVYLGRERTLPNRAFCGCMFAFLGAMTLLVWSQHWGLLWVAMEATTLASAPLIYFHRTRHSLEATWRYLIICSVAIALALLGSFFLAYASLHGGLGSSLVMGDLLARAPDLSRPWLHAAVALLLVGYGTKMGLAPMHTWLPDAHGEAPAPISAMLSGALLPCAFLPILRAFQLCAAAGDAVFAQRMLLGLGLLSMLVAGVLAVRERDLKRLLAYSSIEQMGILVFAVGIGGVALFGALLHTLNSSLAKSVLFLASGNIYQAYGSKSIDDVAGVLRRLPWTGTFFLAGFLAISGTPPFGPFTSLFTILDGTMRAGQYAAGAAMLGLLLLVFVSMGSSILSAVQGRPSEAAAARPYRESVLACAPMALLLGALLVMGISMPPMVQTLLGDAARLMGVHTW